MKDLYKKKSTKNRKEKAKMSNIDVVLDYSKFKFNIWLKSLGIWSLSYALQITSIVLFASYFFVALNMPDKFFTFVISGKVVGSSYVLQLRDVYIMSIIILGSILAKSTYYYLKHERNRNKIKLRIKEAPPLSLEVRVAA